MLTLRITLLFLLTTTFTYAQGFKLKYKKFLEPGSKMIHAGFNYSVEKTKDKTFILKRYYPSTKQLTLRATYADAKLKRKEGRYSEWMDDGQLWYEGTYQNNEKNGEWRTWVHGNQYKIGNYKDGKREGEWVQADPGGNITNRRHYTNDELDGLFESFDEEGQLVQKLLYKEGQLEEIILQDSTNRRNIDGVSEEMPAFPGCEPLKLTDSLAYRRCTDRLMLTHIYRNIKYPPKARENGIEGKTVSRFVINKEGGVEDIKVLRGVSDEIKAECIRVIESMPKWHPGYQNGKPVKVYFTLPINFNLE